MDDYAGDKKNHYMFSFLFLLIERRVFEIGFTLVGHTHMKA
jgi:hypothetical protein